MADKKRVVVTGATGLIGKALCKALQADGYDVVVFARDPEQARRVVPGAVDYVPWSVSSAPGPWAAHIDGAWGVMNLAGTPVAGKRWTEQRKREIRDSRVIGTRGIVAAITAAARKPQVLVNASAIGYYGPRDDTPLDENAPAGHDFLAGVVADWEAEARKAEDAGVRTVMV
ncbi:MAG: SDR family NAD(P)-dependent oxidoreductase, partial [Chloroflexi bacterium]|nr:SDR family NAD(P)-dependent oxidoreductase [Chloroflexota bacterium]